MLSNLKLHSEEILPELQGLINLAQALTEWDQYQTQDSLDGLQKLIAEIHRLNSEQDSASFEFNEALKLA